MNTSMDRKRLFIFLAIACGISWLVALGLYLSQGRLNTSFSALSGQLVVTLVVGFGYMWGPALANILTRVLTREGWGHAFLRPNFRRGWPYWFLAWLGPVVLTVAGMVVYFLVFPEHYDASMPLVREQLEASGVTLNIPSWVYGLLQLPNVLLVGLVINSFFTFGEEFGWRAYLLQKLLPLGPRWAVVISGVIWGLWHWPMIAMGHNYGLNYAGAPWLGILVMTWFTLWLGVILSWLVLRGGSVWPAVIGHAIINAVAGLGMIWVSGQPNLLLGPTAAGLVGGIGFTLAGLILFLWPGALPGAESLSEKNESA
jgi:membrane protease YdiL (CAAX protease family)